MHVRYEDLASGVTQQARQWVPSDCREYRVRAASMLSQSSFMDTHTDNGVVFMQVPLSAGVEEVRVNETCVQHFILCVSGSQMWPDHDVTAQITRLLPYHYFHVIDWLWFTDPSDASDSSACSRSVTMWIAHVLAHGRPLANGDTVCFRCIDDQSVSLPLHTLKALSPRWRQYTPACWHTRFSAPNIVAFNGLLAYMLQCGPAVTMQDVRLALPVAWSHDMQGALHQSLALLEQIDTYTSRAEDTALQETILWCDAHRLRLPHIVMMRLVKTFIGSSWVGVPYMWKVASTIGLPGFPIYRLSSTTLLSLAKLSQEQDASHRTNPVEIAVKQYYVQKILHRALVRRASRSVT